MPGELAEVVEGAVAEMERFEIPEGGPAAFGMFDSFAGGGEALRALGAKIERLAVVARAGPVETAVGITWAGWGGRFSTVWSGALGAEAAGQHWGALETELEARRQLLRGLGVAMGIMVRIAAVMSAGTNPVGAIRAARGLGGQVEELIEMARGF